MKYIKLYEEYNNIDIPNEIAIWFMDFYASQNIKFLIPNDIPQYIYDNSRKFIKEYFKSNTLYRGESRDYEITNPITFSPNNNQGISWTIDKYTAMGFIEPDTVLYDYLYELNLNKIKYPVSIDYIMNNITDEQIQMITNPITKTQMKNYVSESEVLVFDTITSNDMKVKLI